eukprot:TRINITY_DN1059_c0_g1_i3.p2 TRINITY_DN1059_c0_g1~~TRINITY_DN1059_c0_g1_i3.p2  ORF type:complete len:169 (+),score=31.58 TRINITY_DN1059_c0_g1_i3:717-1223(+)
MYKMSSLQNDPNDIPTQLLLFIMLNIWGIFNITEENTIPNPISFDKVNCRHFMSKKFLSQKNLEKHSQLKTKNFNSSFFKFSISQLAAFGFSVNCQLKMIYKNKTIAMKNLSILNKIKQKIKNIQIDVMNFLIFFFIFFLEKTKIKQQMKNKIIQNKIKFVSITFIKV